MFQFRELTLEEVEQVGGGYYYSSGDPPGGGGGGDGGSPDDFSAFHHSALAEAIASDGSGGDDGLLTIDLATMMVGWSDQAENYTSGGGGGGSGGRGFDSTDDESGYFWHEMSSGDWDWANHQATNAINHDINQIFSGAATIESGIQGVKAYLIDVGLGSLTAGGRDGSYNASNGYHPSYYDASGAIVVTAIGNSGLQYIPSIVPIGDIGGAVTWSPPPPPGQGGSSPVGVAVNLSDHTANVGGHNITVHDDISGDPSSAVNIAKIDAALSLIVSKLGSLGADNQSYINNVLKLEYTGTAGRSGIQPNGTFILSKTDVDAYNVFQLATSIIHDGYHLTQRAEHLYDGITYGPDGQPSAGDSANRIVALERQATQIQITAAQEIGAPQWLINGLSRFANPNNTAGVISRFNESVSHAP